MVKTNRLDGLIYLKNQQLPVPDFLIVKSISSLNDNFFNKEVPFGWTIRTCKKNGQDEISLFYKNNISLNVLKKILFERLKIYSDEFYIVYPSWDFDFSFNILKTRYEFTIEGEMGSQKAISSGIVNPNYTIIISSLDLRIKYIQPNLIPKIKRGIYRALKLLLNNIYNKTYYTEVAITKQNQIYFYEFRDIEQL